MIRQCARCGVPLRHGQGGITRWEETGSGPGQPSYACAGCARPTDATPHPAATFVGRPDRPPLLRPA